MKLLLKVLRKGLPVWILSIGFSLFFLLIATKPEPVRRTPPEPVIEVEVARLVPQDYPVVLKSQGTVSARTESTLIPEVTGKILEVAPNLREGGFFEEGEVLLVIDPRDYETALIIARANLAEARVRLAEEDARARQAQRDWERLGDGEAPGDLVLRGPQLALARATVAAAEARVLEAERNLERTRITAPYDGRVLAKNVDLGQVVGQGTVLAKVYAVDYAEIRLPLTSNEYAYLDMRPVVRGQTVRQDELPAAFYAKFGPEEVSWEGRIVRVEGAIDTRSRQIFVVGQVDDPYGPANPQPLKVGLFVQAEIQGTVLEDVYVLPRTAFREARYILTLDEENRIHRKEVDPLWMDAEVIVFRDESIPAGTLVSITQIALAIDGMQVQPAGQERRKKGPGAKRPGGAEGAQQSSGGKP